MRFVEKDISAILEFLDLIQGGTHAIVISYTSAQLAALKMRMDGSLRFLISVSQTQP